MEINSDKDTQLVHQKRLRELQNAQHEEIEKIQRLHGAEVSRLSEQHEDFIVDLKSKQSQQAIDQQQENKKGFESTKFTIEREIDNLQSQGKLRTTMLSTQQQAEQDNLIRNHSKLTHALDLQHQRELKGLEEQNSAQKKSVLENQASWESKQNEVFTERQAKQTNFFKSHLEENQAQKASDLERIRSETKRILDQIHSTAASKLNEIQDSNSDKLSIYSSLMDDPFYHPKSIPSEPSNNSELWELRVPFADYEKNGVRAFIQGDQLVLSHQKNMSESLNLGNGKKSHTSAMQSFSQNFPLPVDIDRNQLSTYWENGSFVIQIPKKTPYSDIASQKTTKPTPAQAVLERPKFPDHLLKKSGRTPT